MSFADYLKNFAEQPGPGQFRCDLCGGVFDRGRSDEEAMAETHSVFGNDVRLEDCGVVCDDCWVKIHPQRN